MQSLRDQTDRSILLNSPPRRIISTVPSQTELLYDLGLEDNVVGITAYCVHPKHWLKQKPVIGGTKNLNIEKIRQLKPDLIIGNKEENIKEQIEELAVEFPVWLSDIRSIEASVEMIGSLGQITGTSGRAKKISNEISQHLQSLPSDLPSFATACFIWKDPYMIASSDTFIGSMLKAANLPPVEVTGKGRYPQIVLENLLKANPAVVLLLSEPYNFKVEELHQLGEYFPRSLLKIVDGEFMTWYGSRLTKSLAYLQRLRNEIDLLHL